MTIKVSSKQSRSQFYMRTECCCWCCSVCCYAPFVAAAAVLLLPAAVRHRVPDGQICCWFIESDPSVFFLPIQARFLSDGTPWQSCIAFTDTICLHPRWLRACAEPRRASARRSEVALVYTIIFVSSKAFVFFLMPYIIIYTLVWLRFGSHVLWIILTFLGRCFLASGMLIALPVTVGTAPWGVSRTLAYCAVSPSLDRCLGHPVRSLDGRVPLMGPDYSDISS